MEKFIVVSAYGEVIGVKEAENKEEVTEKIGFDDALIFNVDEAMTLAEHLVDFVAHYRLEHDKVKRSQVYYNRNVADDIYDNLILKASQRTGRTS